MSSELELKNKQLSLKDSQIDDLQEDNRKLQGTVGDITQAERGIKQVNERLVDDLQRQNNDLEERQKTMEMNRDIENQQMKDIRNNNMKLADDNDMLRNKLKDLDGRQ